MRSMVALLGVALVAAPALAADKRPVGTETTIGFAAGGGLRNWQAGPAGSRIVYVQDRRLQWYAVTLTGPCVRGPHGAMRFVYTTDANGTFDRFSHVSSPDTPGATCGVTSIKTSLPPKGQPGAPRG